MCVGIHRVGLTALLEIMIMKNNNCRGARKGKRIVSQLVDNEQIRYITYSSESLKKDDHHTEQKIERLPAGMNRDELTYSVGNLMMWHLAGFNVERKYQCSVFSSLLSVPHARV